MRIVDYIVTTAESFLTDVARNTFLSLVTASGTLVGYMAVIAVALVGILLGEAAIECGDFISCP